MTLIFLTTFFWNLRIGIAVGIGLSLLRLLRHSTRPRIQILGRVPGTQDFENAETDPDALEFASHCLIVKIPEPLTFANTGSLKDRLRRLEDHNSTAAHPAQPKKRKPEQYNRHLIFDIHGVTALDPAACQVLLEIVESYIERGTRVYFSRIPSRRSEVWRLMVVSGIVEVCGGEKFFLRSVGEALKMSEREETLSLWAESARGSPEGSVLSGSAVGGVGGSAGVGGVRRSGTIEREGEDGSTTTAATGEVVAVEGTR
jgi:MFS superfamily sulfate permease-like transporter